MAASLFPRTGAASPQYPLCSLEKGWQSRDLCLCLHPVSLGRGPQTGSAPRPRDAGARGLHLWGTDGVHDLQGGDADRGALHDVLGWVYSKAPQPRKAKRCSSVGPQGVSKGQPWRHSGTTAPPLRHPLSAPAAAARPWLCPNPRQAGGASVHHQHSGNGLWATGFAFLPSSFFFFFPFPPLWKTIFECLDHAGVSGAVYSEQG